MSFAPPRSPASPEAAGNRPTILVLAKYYLPSERAGGGLRTIVNLIDRLGDRFQFRVVTTDRDLGAAVPYTSVSIGQWNRVGNADVFYGNARALGVGGLRRLIRSIRPDAVYINSFFSPLGAKYLLLRRLGLIDPVGTVIAPEGELAADARRNKAGKKTLFRLAARVLRLHAGVIWKAAAPHEAEAIRRLVSGSRDVRVAANMPPPPPREPPRVETKAKQSGELRLIFLARILPIKNLLWALRAIDGLSGDRIVLDVYGPIEDAAYWAECQHAIAALSANVTVQYRGVLAADAVGETFARYHFMILPTLTENFGHVIIEALAAACPVVISNRTPWLRLEEQGVGWDLPLEDLGAWRRTLTQCVEMDDATHRAMAARAWTFASTWLRAPEVERENTDVLLAALQPRRVAS